MYSFIFVCHGISVEVSQQFGGVSSIHHVGSREGIQVIREVPFPILPSLVINFLYISFVGDLFLVASLCNFS